MFWTPLYRWRVHVRRWPATFRRAKLCSATHIATCLNLPLRWYAFACVVLTTNCCSFSLFRSHPYRFYKGTMEAHPYIMKTVYKSVFFWHARFLLICYVAIYAPNAYVVHVTSAAWKWHILGTRSRSYRFYKRNMDARPYIQYQYMYRLIEPLVSFTLKCIVLNDRYFCKYNSSVYCDENGLVEFNLQFRGVPLIWLLSIILSTSESHVCY